jgi:hypothetical protein
MKRRCLSSLAVVGFVVLVYGPSPALAQGYLGTNLRPFAVLAGTPNVTCTGASLVTGDVGISPAAAIIGFGGAPCTDVGVLHAADATAGLAQADLVTAFNALSLPCAATVGPDLTGLTLVQGVYCVNAAASNLTGTLTLNAAGNPNAVWVFRMSSTLITSSGSTVSVIGGGSPCAVEWQVSSSATLGTGTTFVGNILALTSITMTTGANLTGRALARNGAVTMDTNTISNAGCLSAAGVPPPFPGPGVPTLPEIGVWTLLVVVLGSGVYLLRRRTPTEASR